MKAATTTTYDQAWTMFQAGSKNEGIMEATGLNYSQMWRDRTARQLEADMLPGHSFIATDGSNTATAAAMAALRAKGESWGLISVKARMPESRARKLFAEATGIDSVGLRTGKGGRYVADDGRFYSGSDRAQYGTELVPGVPVLEQVPDPTSEAVRNLPTVANALVAPSGARVRKPGKRTTAPKATAKVKVSASK